ncbi:hypothetical protein ACFSR7_36320 [Cohnella sp. GCM10020058]|uniref:hypothetical protein n=1 Tax=Cohnella sp. GCM10020058 TaxID=3317330 RepID=UPI003641547B
MNKPFTLEGAVALAEDLTAIVGQYARFMQETGQEAAFEDWRAQGGVQHVRETSADPEQEIERTTAAEVEIKIPNIVYTLEAARLLAGFTEELAARFLRITVDELRECERNPSNTELYTAYLMGKLYDRKIADLYFSSDPDLFKESEAVISVTRL